MSESEGDSTTVVINNGSWTTSAGFCGDDAPRVVVPTVVKEVKIQRLRRDYSQCKPIFLVNGENDNFSLMGFV